MIAEAESRGLAMLASGDAAGAQTCFRALLAEHPGDPHALHGLACVARVAGRDDLAIGLAGRAIAARPAAYFHITLGLSLAAQGHLAEARAALRVAILKTPDDPRARRALAQMLETGGDLAEAVVAWRAEVDLQPFDGEAHLALARCARLAGDWSTASRAADAAVRHTDCSVAALQERATLHSATGAAVAAEKDFAAIVALRPDDPAALANHGAALFSLNRLNAAQDVLARSVMLAPDVVPTLVNLGLVLMGLGDLIGARDAFARALTLAPGDPRVLVNAATLFTELGNMEGARSLYRQIAQTAAGDGDWVRAAFNTATIDLAEGLFARGWQGFEQRLLLLERGTATTVPAWDGQSAGCVLIEAEQGLGDQIQFLRFVPEAARRAQVAIRVGAPLTSLVTEWVASLGAAGYAVTMAEDGLHYDFHCGVGSLPHLLNSESVPDRGTYLGRHVGRTGAQRPLRVGLCWAGNPNYRFDRRRSIRPDLLAGLGRVAGVCFVSLQHAADAVPFVMEQPDLPDFAVMRDVMMTLDLVISVDTAVAHLAGAIGCPVWMLNRFGGDWRWAPALRDATGTRSLWYPSMRIWQVSGPDMPDEGWISLLGQVETALRDLVH